MDAEIVIGFDSDLNVQTVTAFLEHFVGSDETVADGALYYVSGKVASIDSGITVGDDFSLDQYDFLIDANVVSHTFLLH
jgi:hypothetical protein